MEDRRNSRQREVHITIVSEQREEWIGRASEGTALLRVSARLIGSPLAAGKRKGNPICRNAQAGEDPATLP